jgi:zinc/manganese transport system substrate-binding protein
MKTTDAAHIVQVVAAENFWGSIAAQLGGSHAKVTSIIVNPNSDPHSYEPTSGDLRTIADAGLVVINGIGYDTWATKAVAANGSSNQHVITVGKELGLADNSNPHRWYNPDNMHQIVLRIVEAYKAIDPSDSKYFDEQATAFDSTAIVEYNSLISQIKAKYSGVPVGASESIFAMLAPSLGLKLLTPASFLRAISEGADPTAADKSAIDTQIKNRLIKVYVYNSQNATPDIQTQIAAAKAAGIPISTITETLTPPTDSWEQWQASQLKSLLAALAKATGR